MGRPKKNQELLVNSDSETPNSPVKYITADEFEDFQNKVLGILEKVVNNDGNKEQKKEIFEDNSSVAKLNEEGLPPQYQKIFEKYFDPDDGFSARLNFPEQDEKGNEMGGIMFTIVVPNNLSNATKAYLDFYKVDLRSKPLQPGAIANGIDNWCKMVAKNIRYDRKFKIK